MLGPKVSGIDRFDCNNGILLKGHPSRHTCVTWGKSVQFFQCVKNFTLLSIS